VKILEPAPEKREPGFRYGLSALGVDRKYLRGYPPLKRVQDILAHGIEAGNFFELK